jgi:hypothetical protein
MSACPLHGLPFERDIQLTVDITVALEKVNGSIHDLSIEHTIHTLRSLTILLKTGAIHIM